VQLQPVEKCWLDAKDPISYDPELGELVLLGYRDVPLDDGVAGGNTGYRQSLTEAELNRLKIPQLKVLLRERTLKVGGKKAELVARLGPPSLSRSRAPFS